MLGEDNRFEHPRCPALPVDIFYLCSNKSTTSVTAAEIQRISGAISDSPHAFKPRIQRGWNRLSDEQRAEVARCYEAGDTTTQLAKVYGVAKSTIIGILRERIVVVRRQPLTPENVSEAKRLYESGLSLSQTAERLSVNQETMRMAIIRVGVALREPTGAKTLQA